MCCSLAHLFNHETQIQIDWQCKFEFLDPKPRTKRCSLPHHSCAQLHMLFQGHCSCSPNPDNLACSRDQAYFGGSRDCRTKGRGHSGKLKVWMIGFKKWFKCKKTPMSVLNKKPSFPASTKLYRLRMYFSITEYHSSLMNFHLKLVRKPFHLSQGQQNIGSRWLHYLLLTSIVNRRI